MKLYVKKLLIIVSSLQISCAMGMLTVQTDPDGADVYLIHEGQQPIKIGKTPLNVNSQQINSQAGSSVQIHIKKDGYTPESFVVPKTAFSSAVNLSLSMNEVKMPSACTEQANAFDKAARLVAKAQNLIHQKKYDQSLQLLNNLAIDNPSSSVVNDLIGNVYYLQKNIIKALDYYESSLRIDPESNETKRMVMKLRSILGTRAPANQGGR